MPHHIDHPHPTRQKINVNACARPTNVFTRNEPMRARAPSCCENRGIPKHKQNIPEKRVPEIQKKNEINREIKYYIELLLFSLFWNIKFIIFECPNC